MEASSFSTNLSSERGMDQLRIVYQNKERGNVLMVSARRHGGGLKTGSVEPNLKVSSSQLMD